MQRLSLAGRASGLLVMSFFMCIFGGCRPPTESERLKARLAYIEFAADLPFFVALKYGYFNDVGVDVEAVKCGNSTEALNAVLAGKADGAMGNSLSALFAIQLKSPGELRLILPFEETTTHHVSHLLVKRASRIRSVSGLRGKRIGTYSGATQLLYLKLFLRQVGLDPQSDVTIVQVAPNMQVQALEAGQFEALFSLEPYTTIALQKGIARDLMPFPRRKIMDPFPSGASSFSKRFAAEDKETARKVLVALSRAVDFIRDDPTAAKRCLADYSPLGPELAPKTDIYNWLKQDEYDLAAVQAEADLFAEHQILGGKADVRQMFLTPTELGLTSWKDLR